MRRNGRPSELLLSSCWVSQQFAKYAEGANYHYLHVQGLNSFQLTYLTPDQKALLMDTTGLRTRRPQALVRRLPCLTVPPLQPFFHRYTQCQDFTGTEKSNSKSHDILQNSK